jgi:hypothetical protein
VAEIQLYQRSQTPQTVQMAKPSMALASTVGQQSAGAAIAGFSGKIFSDLVEAKIGNEIHSFLGQVDTAQAEFEGYVKNNPGASFEDIGNARESMIEGINKAGQNLSLPKSKDYAENWMSSNRKALMVKSQTAVESIMSKRELEKFNLLREQYTKTGEIDKLTDLYKRQKGKLVDPEISDLMLQSDMAVMQKGRNMNLAFSELQSIASVDGWDSALNKINDVNFQKQYGLDADSIGELSTRISQQKSIADENLKQTIEKQNTQIGDAILKNDPNVFDTIKNSSLSYDQKKKWVEEVRSQSGRDDKVYNDLLSKVSQEPDKYDSAFLAKHITKGINRDDYNELNGILTSAKSKDDSQKVIHRQYVSAINDMQTRKLFNSGTSEQDKLDNINKATRSMVALENWSKKNPNATSAQYQEFFKVLTMPSISSYGVRISQEERQEIIANTGIDLYDGLDLFGLVSGVEGVKAQAEIDKKREALLSESATLEPTVKRKENESIDDYIKRTGSK